MQPSLPPKAASDSEPEFKVVTETCPECGTEFSRKIYSLFGRHIGGKLCPACFDKQQAERVAEHERHERIQREYKWNAVCPLIYRDTNLNDARLNKHAVETVLRWEPRQQRGLGLIGKTGRGKTRCMFMALRKSFDLDLTVASISHTKLSRIAMDAFSGDKEERADARDVLRSLHSAAVVLLDDLGKPPSTERADSELEELIEERTSQGKPILWTANGSGEWLIKRFGTDRGEPLVRRLAEFSEVTTL